MEDKARQRALEAYPKETRDITGFVVDIGHPQYMRDLYIEGYHQAEKDLALTWQDIKVIEKLLGFDNIIESPKEYYQEVLNRFNEERKEK